MSSPATQADPTRIPSLPAAIMLFGIFGFPKKYVRCEALIMR